MTTEILCDGLCFGEGPRWHDGVLWLSDMHAHEVITVDAQGRKSRVVEVPNRPSGLGWLPGGQLLVVSMLDQSLFRLEAGQLTLHADLSALTDHNCNDMVVDSTGRAYVGNFGFNLGESPRGTNLICVEPDGQARIVADDLVFPNGCVITPDGRTLIVAETFASRLSAYDITDNGDLSNRRIWAELPEGAVPDGICLDSANGIWSASPTSNECIRQLEGSEITDRIAVSQGAFACMLGGPELDTLFILTAPSSDPEDCAREQGGRVEYCQAPAPGAGRP
jgi:sugar lactone lactonase YvrE